MHKFTYLHDLNLDRYHSGERGCCNTCIVWPLAMTYWDILLLSWMAVRKKSIGMCGERTETHARNSVRILL
jgi:hypothetical protein